MSDERDVFVEAAGVRLRARVVGGDLPATPALVLHGFTGSVESMSGVTEALAADRPVVALDLVGHGESDAPEDPVHYTMDACVAHVVGALAGLGIPRAHIVGYSMGGRVALSVCVARPERVSSMIVVGASPGLADPDARAARVEADHTLARRIVDGGLERFVDDWMALPLFSSQRSLGREVLGEARRQRLRCRAEGLVGSLRGMGTGAMVPLHDRLKEIAQPVCLVAGARDEKFAQLALEMERRLPNARCELVVGVGHAAHLEDPASFARLARAFLAAHEQRQEIHS